MTGNASPRSCAMRDKTGKWTSLHINKPKKYMDSKIFIVSFLIDSLWMPWDFCKRKRRIPASASLNNP